MKYKTIVYLCTTQLEKNMSAKQFIGLLNQTLKGVSIVSGETPTKESAKFIASGIYKSIGKHSIAKEFEQYCQTTYDIDIII